jgi:hypothetical protein
VKPKAEGGAGKSAATGITSSARVLAFLTKYLKSELHPFRLEVRELLHKLAEEQRVPDLSPQLFRRILDATPEPVRPIVHHAPVDRHARALGIPPVRRGAQARRHLRGARPGHEDASSRRL